MQVKHNGQAKEKEVQSQPQERKSQFLWKYQSRRKSNQSVLRHFQISLSNKYSCLDIDGMKEINSDEPIYKEKQQWKMEMDGMDTLRSHEPNWEEIQQWKMVNNNWPKKKEIKSKQKHFVKYFETENPFSALKELNEEDIENVVNRKAHNASERKKCKSCNFKTKCYDSPTKCKAIDNYCYSCKKPTIFLRQEIA